MLRLSSWDDVVAKLYSRLSKWKLKTLSIGGHLTLIKSVLSSFLLYYMSSFKVPKGIPIKMESIRRNFFNGVENSDKKMYLICWKKILASKKNGDLGVSSFLLLIALIFSNGFGGLLLMVLLFGPVLLQPFMVFVEHLTVLLLIQDDLLGSILSPRSGIDEDQLLFLISNTSSIMLPNISDRWNLRLDSSGVFSVKLAREFIDDSFLPKGDVPTRWVKSIPIKTNIFAWRVSLDKLPTRLNHSLRGLDIPSISFPLCSIVVESSSHILFSCQLARQLRLMVACWWELEYQDILSYDNWLLRGTKLHGIKELIHGKRQNQQ
ncbi:RNA-directed DNA polymerase, eukaryota, partial [Tanacetum coccineum]